MSNKRINVSSDTQIQMTSVYTRNGKGKERTKRTYNFVIKGILLSTALVGSVLLSSCGTADVVKDTGTKIDNTAGVHEKYQEEQVITANLKMATKVLESAISKGQITANMYENLMTRLVAVEAQLVTGGVEANRDEMLSVVDYTDKVVKSKVETTDAEILTKRAKSIQALSRVQDMLDVMAPLRRVDELEKAGVIVEVEDASAVEGGNTDSNYVEKKTDEQYQQEALNEMNKNGDSYIGKPRENTETKLNKPSDSGASSSNVQTQSTTATVSSASTQTQTASQPAQAQPVQAQPVQAQPVVSKPAEPVVQAPSPQYYGHTYNTKSQDEYSQVIQIAKNKMSGYQNGSAFSEAIYQTYFDRYMNGERPSNFEAGSLDHRGFTIVEGIVGQMVQAGISKGEIERALKANTRVHNTVSIPGGSQGANPRSAYDLFVRGQVDCDSSAQAVSALYDVAGYQSKVVYYPNHAEVQVNIGGVWWQSTGSGFQR